MKNYISIFMLICFASFSNAQNDFENQWENVIKLEKEGLTKSASELVETIYQNALKAKNKQQQIKALLHKSKYMLILEEDAQLNIVSLFKKEIETSEAIITKSLLENMLATMYWQYFQQNRYKFYNRTKTESKLSDDFRSWDLETLFNEIHIYYQKSLENRSLLQQESLENYSLLLNEAKESKTYRPTLFDLLSHNALEFYKTDENSITKPAYQFKIDQPEYLSDSEKFIDSKINSKDSTSLQLNALKVYQNLLKFHEKDKSSKAFATVDIERLNFVFQNATIQNKEALLLQTLEKKVEELKASPVSALYNFEIASLYKNQGDTYNANANEKEEDFRWKLKHALELCNKVIQDFPKSEGAEKCKVLKEEILKPSINLVAERFIAINSSSLLKVNYKNLNNLNFKIYKVSQKQLRDFNTTYDTDKKENILNKLKVFKTFESPLKNESDYQYHSTEIIIPKLENGLYLIKAETDSKQNAFAVSQIQITDFALIESSANNTQSFQLIDRNNGKPIVDANIKLTYVTNRDKSVTKTFTTNRYGKFSFQKDDNTLRNVSIIANFNNEEGYFGDYYIYRYYDRTEDNDTEHNVFLFTDRSIYRPGQTVYFKGITIKTENNKTTVTPNKEVDVRLYNNNRQLIKELQLQTNDFGSAAGEFILPNDGLTGQYYIEFGRGKVTATYFSVEEYKRPKFKPEFQPITETYKVNDSITVKGKAIAFAGSNITDAKVVYRVKRQVRYPDWWYWRRPNYYNSEAQEITFGEGITNDKGEFEITFKALPDESVSKDNLPVFNYEVTADITDINGETRTATTVVNVGHHAMTLQIASPSTIDKSKKEIEISLNSKNLNGEEVPAKGTLKIYKLEAPDYVLRARPWKAPDYQVISEEEFKSLFPHDAYSNEQLVQNWKKGEEVFSTDFNTETSKIITLKKLKKWDSGKYIIVAESKDKFGQEVKDEVYTTLYSNDDKTVADNQLFETSLDKNNYKTGDIAKLTLGSAATDITITVDIEKNHKIISTQLVRLSNSKTVIPIPVLDGDLGGFEVHISFAAFNAFVSQSLKINVPYPKTDLEIETTTFRDKLQPGQNETWSFKIKGPKGDKVSAELLASMYDASLDEFRAHNWNFNPISNPTYYSNTNKNASESFGTSNFRLFNRFNNTLSYPHQNFDQLNWFGFYFGFGRTKYLLRGRVSGIELNELTNSAFENDDELESFVVMDSTNKKALIYNSITEQSGGTILGKKKKITSDKKIITGMSQMYIYDVPKKEDIQIRKNLNETAFFFPQLQTDEDGNVSFNFKAPEALTKWKLQLLAHTKTLESSVKQLETVTQKELMVIPNVPRFLREGDVITVSTKIANLTEKELSGFAQLILTNSITGEDISANLLSSSPLGKLEGASFSVDAKGNTQVSWKLNIPKGLQAVQYQIIAKAGDFSDGEQNALPVLSNRMLVTKTLPIWIRSNETKTFTLDKLKDNTSTTLTNHKLTLEMTSNPAWYAVQALPYLMEYPYDCNEQTFSRYYANALAQHIVKSNPKIEAVFNQWKSSDALLSNLEKNQELKSLLIQETPWLRDAQSETEQKKRIGLLFDLNKMNNELNSALRKLKQNQLPSGAWPWFNGGYANRFITQHIISGFGHLKQLNVIQSNSETTMIQNAIQYLDAEFVKEYKDIKKYNKNTDLSKDHLSYTQLHYMYVRSFFPEVKASKEVETIMDYYKSQMQKYWLKRSLYAKGLMTLTLHRMNDDTTAGKILKSLKENSITSDELGMYWKANTSSWYWHQAPIETQSLLVEAFSEAGTVIQSETKNLEDIDNLKIWLLKNKQTNKWETTKATTEAVYALLLQGSSWLDVTEMVDVKVGNETINPVTLDNVKAEAGTGYYKTSWTGEEITAEQANVTISKKGDGIAWGALYWQYFEDLDKITSAESPLKLSKKLFLKSNTDKGEEISEITKDTKLNVGDLVRVRIELRSDRDMEFVHLKDMRAAGFEPINVLSQYKWQDGLGYYESTKDAATNFFMDYLPKGVYVFEYDLRVNNAGDMSNGISTIQSMYAPEFSSHSEGVRVKVD
ncbi:MG2 domain-containing protein [Winogradskyella sp. SYSU M77433]|uniref:alpha-2-macroglobulin family protein n=1 Tax=Winogradskyella sp. SYSU M77433 TaxID=3042722 RepID=UPI0024812353|nr:MG2 domain-containing protein [Winogradskyella sp. SYSU M77433]MDH7914554.1 MG2 domain-containing protein [Winogradskyella sp. SYSU M77433]